MDKQRRLTTNTSINASPSLIVASGLTLPLWELTEPHCHHRYCKPCEGFLKIKYWLAFRTIVDSELRQDGMRNRRGKLEMLALSWSITRNSDGQVRFWTSVRTWTSQNRTWSSVQGSQKWLNRTSGLVQGSTTKAMVRTRSNRKCLEDEKNGRRPAKFGFSMM